MWQRTDQRKSSQRRNSWYSCLSKTPHLISSSGSLHAVDVFGNPEQRVQVPQPAFAVLDVRFDQIARLSAAPDAVFAFRELGGDEIGGGVAHDFVVKARHQFVEQLAVAEQKARFENGGADRHVRLRLADAFIDRAGGVADLQPRIPQGIKNRFRNQLAPGGLFVRKQKQEIDVGAGRLQAAAVAAGRDDGHAFAFRWIVRRILVARKFVQDADDLVFHPAKALGAAAAVTVVQQQLLGLGATFGKRRLQALRQHRTQFLLAAAVRLDQLLQFAGQRACVDQIVRAPGGVPGRGVRNLIDGKGSHGHPIAEVGR